MALTTANVVVTRSGTGWTVDVTNCNLLSDLSIKDFVMLIEGTAEPNANITKTSQTVLTYNGSSISSSTVEVRRLTPENRFQDINFTDTFSSTVFNEEIDRLIRKHYEYTLNGIGPGSVATIQTPLDDAYSASWNGDTLRPATRNALYDKFELQGDLADNEAITGTWTAPTAADATNNTQLATTAFAHTRVTNALSGSPALGGNPTAATQAVDNNTTRIATTAFVQTQLENVPTATQGDTDESAANTRFVTEMVNPIALVNTRSLQVASTATLGPWAYTVEASDVNSAYNTGNGRFTVPTNGAGIYLVMASINVIQSSGSTQGYALEVRINGGVAKRIDQRFIASGQGQSLMGSCHLSLSDADYVDIVLQNFGTVSTNYGNGGSVLDWASFQRIGSALAIT